VNKHFHAPVHPTKTHDAAPPILNLEVNAISKPNDYIWRHNHLTVSPPSLCVLPKLLPSTVRPSLLCFNNPTNKSIHSWSLPLHLLSPLTWLTLSRPPPPPTHTGNMSWFQKSLTLPSKSRGSYLVTDHIESQLPEIKNYKIGLLNLFIQHTSCALSLNENWDEDVREDMSDALDRIAPEDRKGNLYRHSAEGLDDMPVSRTPPLQTPFVVAGFEERRGSLILEI
jgi:thiamine phosphate synthase YjbQ (UPF0047 family)